MITAEGAGSWKNPTTWPEAFIAWIAVLIPEVLNVVKLPPENTKPVLGNKDWYCPATWPEALIAVAKVLEAPGTSRTLKATWARPTETLDKMSAKSK